MNLSEPNIYLEELNNVFSQAPITIRIIRAKDYVVEFANDYYLDLVNKNTEIIGKPLFETFPELIAQGLKTAIDNVFETGVPYVGKEFPIDLIKNKVSKKYYFNFVYKPLREIDGTISKLILVATDVTEQVNYQIKSEEAEHLYHELIYSSPSMMAVFKGETMIIDIANDSILESWGKGKDIIGKSVFEVMPEIIEQGFDRLLLDVFRTGTPFFAYEQAVNIVRHGAMETMYYNFVYQPQRNVNGKISGVAVIANEVSTQALINKKIKESESNFRITAELMIEKLSNANPEGIATYYNKSWTDYTGASFDELINDGWSKFVHPDDLADTHKNWNHSWQTGTDFEMEFRLLNHRGEYRWHISKAKCVKDEEGNIKLWIGTQSDIQDQKNKTQELEEAVASRTAELQIANEELQQKNQEIALSMYNKRFLTEFAERFSDNKLSNEFFDSVVKFIADTTGVDYVFIGKLKANGKHKTNVHTIAMTAFGKIVDNIIYPLSDGPCSEVIHGAVYNYPENCKKIFPLNGTLIKYNVEGYVGLPLYDSQGKPFALIAAMCQRKIKDPETISSILKIVARRVEIEFERINNEEILAENNRNLNYKNTALKKINEELNVKNKEIIETREQLLSEYSRSLIEATLDPLFVISPKGKITDMNKAAIQVIGLMRQKLTGTNFYDYFTDPKNARKVYKEVFLKGFVADYPLTIKDHVLTDVLFNGSVYKDDQGNVLGAVVVARDITEQKKVEQQLQDSKTMAEMASSVAEDARILAEDARQIAESATKLKQQFLSNMSHEIRTPMNAIIGFTKVMLKTDLTEKQTEYLNAIKLSGDALIVLINDILDLAKVESGKMTFEQIPFKLSSSISSMLHLFEPKLQEKNIKLIKEYDKKIPEVLLGDPSRLNQIILNLLSNAVKFTAEGKITVNVQLISEDDKKVSIKFAVTDTGIGIKKEDLANIFNNFQQASNETSRLYGGTGLGLAIVKQLLEPQGGHILVESEINEGSKFSFILSFLKTKAKAELIPDILQLDIEMKEIKVLVVEDMALNQLLMRTLLDDFGFKCDIADNGKLAIEKMKTHHYDIILMDLQMPEMNGFEATEYIRNTMKSTIPIIALTADVTTVDVGKCKQAGMNDYIAKPIDEKILYSKIVTLVKNAVPNLAEKIETITEEIEKIRYINLQYLHTLTKSNPTLIKEMIGLYLQQTPPLISLMKKSFHAQDWKLLSSAVHKMIPSFAIIGMSKDFETMAHKIQDFANTQILSDDISAMVLQLETACEQACVELEAELINMNN